MYAYHLVNLRPYQVEAFTYAVPSEDANDCVIICINIKILMGWVDSLNYFCAF